MRITIIQPDIVWEKPYENRHRIAGIIDTDTSSPDLILLPEMFTTGFSMNSQNLAESMKGETIGWMKEISSAGGFAIAGSIIVKENSNYYNRLLFITPDGSCISYDKGHLFRMEKENRYFAKGNSPVITTFKGFGISLQICYDLRFPVWSRCVANNYHILIYVANWPEARRHIWKSLLIARAIENQCYVLGVNRVGSDGSGIEYSGDSMVIGPTGEILSEIEPYTESVASVTLSLNDLDQFRQKFPAWRDADSFLLG